ncbi:hypothetical protein HPB48_000046 [Haemaphysalis longicornis]|uniref:DDE Tnp4 domain-containing protein n=1 Tax=Haemaphysalis longicornis TaxID=44386 RepID=A0A9J6FUL9_HAELO|nr:hypothetical protein HPB48_000046 [Haemaphysalis longicornis]
MKLSKKAMDFVAPSAAIIQSVIGLMDFDSQDEAFDDVVAIVALKLTRLPRNRIPRYCEEVVSRYCDFEFKKLFPPILETFDRLVVRYMASPFFSNATSGRPRVSAQKTCFVVLCYLGGQCSMYSLADRFDIAVSTVHSCVERMLDFLNSLSAEMITWPDRQEQECSKAGFLAKSDDKGPQNTVGCIDGCHVEINKPTESPNSYCNQKKFPSIVLQGIANDRSKFLDVFIGFPGSAHDTRILRESTFFQEAVTKCMKGYILGDSAYPLLPWLMPPYRDNGQTFPLWKKKHNKVHSQQRVAIESAFGLLKQRFRRLYFVAAASTKQ